MSLVDALIELGVPDPSNLEDLLAFGDDLYKRIELADLNDTDPSPWPLGTTRRSSLPLQRPHLVPRTRALTSCWTR